MTRDEIDKLWGQALGSPEGGEAPDEVYEFAALVAQAENERLREALKEAREFVRCYPERSPKHAKALLEMADAALAGVAP